MIDLGTLGRAMEEGNVEATVAIAHQLLAGTQTSPAVTGSDLAMLQVEVANWLREKQQYGLAINLLETAIKACRRDTEFDLRELAGLLESMAGLLLDAEDPGSSAQYLAEALDITREIEDPCAPQRLQRLLDCADEFEKAGNTAPAARLRIEHAQQTATGVRAARMASAPRRANPLSLDIDDGKRSDIVRVHFGTHRKQRGRKNAYDAFSAERDTRMHYGFVDVSVPRAREIGSLDTPRWRAERSADRASYFVIDSWQLLSSKAEFAESLQRECAASTQKEMLIFVHGYRNSFHSACIQTAQLATDLDIQGPCVAYCWPSRDSTLSYFVDRNQVLRQYVEELKDLIETSALRSGAKRVHILAHSLGSEFLLEGLEAITRSGFRAHPMFEEIVFASPDVDAMDFKERAPRLASLGKRVTVYASEHDKALLLSQTLQGARRAGHYAEFLCDPRLQCIDTSSAHEDFIGHSDFSNAAIDDLRAVIWLGVPPRQRMLQEIQTTNGSYWKYEPEEDTGGVEKPYRQALRLLRCMALQDVEGFLKRQLDPAEPLASQNDLRQLQHWRTVQRHVERMTLRR